MGRMYILKVECWTSPKPCGKDFTDEARCNNFRICTSSEFQIRVGPIHGQNVGSMVASRSKTSKQNLTVEVATAVSEAVSSVSSVGPVSETVSSVVVGVSLSLPLGNMDGSGGVGDVASGTSVGSSNSGDGGGGNADGGEGGRGGELGVAGDNRGMGVAHNRGNSVMSRVDTVVELSLSLPLAVVESMAVSETVGPVATVVATKAVSVSVVGISLRLSLPLAVVESVAVSKTVSPVATVVATKTVAVAVVGIGISLRLSSGEGRKGKCQDSLHLSSATFCDKPSPCTLR